jgi:integrase
LCTAWEASKRDVRPVTLATYRTVLKVVKARLGAMKVQDVRRSDLDALVTWLDTEGGKGGRGVSHRTIVLTLGTVRQVFDYAVSEGMIPVNPALGVKAPRRRPEDQRPVTVWSLQDLARFVRRADADRWAALWRLTSSGLRRSEVCGLQWGDVDFDQGTVTVRQARVAFGSQVETDAPKSKASSRVVPIETMHAGSVALLKALRRQQAEDRLKAGAGWADTGYVLVDMLGRPIHPDHYGRRFREVCKHADVPMIRMHDVRHSVATLLHAAGTAPAHAAALLGHGIAVHMQTYVTPTQEGVDTAGATLGRVLAETV